jgi:ABC-type transporter Mla subunit MlaD
LAEPEPNNRLITILAAVAATLASGLGALALWELTALSGHIDAQQTGLRAVEKRVAGLQTIVKETRGDFDAKVNNLLASSPVLKALMAQSASATLEDTNKKVSSIEKDLVRIDGELRAISASLAQMKDINGRLENIQGRLENNIEPKLYQMWAVVMKAPWLQKEPDPRGR